MLVFGRASSLAHRPENFLLRDSQPVVAEGRGRKLKRLALVRSLTSWPYTQPLRILARMSDGHTQRLETALDGRYRIERKLGEGGTASVYLAEDIKHKRKVALKILRPELAAVIGAERFLAEITAGVGRMTETGLSLGTPHYMSPEQASADRELSARSDVYSLGCVLYEMIAGQSPHTGPSAQSILVRIPDEHRHSANGAAPHGPAARLRRSRDVDREAVRRPFRQRPSVHLRAGR